MAAEKRIKILTNSEIAELFGPPVLNANDQRFFFALNDAELMEGKKIRDRTQRCMFVVLLGYFKVKPIILNPGYHQVKHDLKYVCHEVFPGPRLRPFKLDQKVRVRLYHRIFRLMNYERWQDLKLNKEFTHYLFNQARAWANPRSVFDCAIEYL